VRWCVVVFAGFVAVLTIAAADADEPELALTDLTAYHAALEGKTADPANSVTFRDLWDHPDRFEGRRVRVEGTLTRRFRQAAVGTFPALVEAWAVSPTGDPFCLVFPEARAALAEPPLGSVVTFEGTFLRKVRYQGSDTARLAPLVVGDRPPTVKSPNRGRNGGSGPFQGDRLWLDGALGLMAALIVATALARQHLKKPPAAPPDYEPPPEFVEPA
jgi:hypothetical protein